MNSLLDNVIVNIHRLKKDEEIKVQVLDTTPVVKGLQGHLQDVDQTTEGRNSGTAEKDRLITHRYSATLTRKEVKAIRRGMVLVVMKEKDSDIFAFLPLEEAEQTQYVIHSISQVHPAQAFYSMGLTVKEQ